jgi:hypothetical protein
MTTSTTYRLGQYRKDLKKWLECEGLKGAGGSYDRALRKYTTQPEPKAENYDLDGFALRIAAAVKTEEIKNLSVLKNP